VNTRPRLSVIVPFLNEERWLPLCLEALRSQTLPAEHFELIFVDNGSSDRSREILRAYPEVIVLEESIRDPYIARNRGILAARADHLVFLDADCLPDPDWLLQIDLSVGKNDACILLGYLAFPASKSLALKVHEEYYDSKIRYLIEKQLTQCYFGHAGNMVIRAELVRSIGSFPAMPIVGDTEIIHRAIEKLPGAKLNYIPTARVTHAEVTSFRHYLAKIYETGVYSQNFIQVGDFKVVPFKARLNILLRCARLGNYGPKLWSIAIVGLFAAWAFFVLGRSAAYLTKTRRLSGV
jgi:glycosyltransferase involved in cell wall biosynthesis